MSSTSPSLASSSTFTVTTPEGIPFQLSRNHLSGKNFWIKEASGSPTGSLAREAMNRELELLHRFQGPGLARVYRAQNDEEACRVWLHDAESRLLAEMCQTPWSQEPALKFLRSTVFALKRIHAEGWVHGSLSPLSLLWNGDTEETTLMNLDWASPLGILNCAGVEGVLGFCAPEQLGPSNAGVGIPSDIYSLGACLWFLLAGKEPFAVGPPETTYLEQLTRSPIDISLLRPDLPDRVSSLIAVMLRLNPQERFQTLDEMTRFLDGTAGSKPELGHGADESAFPQSLERACRSGARVIMTARLERSEERRMTLALRRELALRGGWLVQGSLCDNPGVPDFSGLVPILEQTFLEIVALNQAPESSLATDLKELLKPHLESASVCLPRLTQRLELPSKLNLSGLCQRAGMQRLCLELLLFLTSRYERIVVRIRCLSEATESTLEFLYSVLTDPRLASLTLLLSLCSDGASGYTEFLSRLRKLSPHLVADWTFTEAGAEEPLAIQRLSHTCQRELSRLALLGTRPRLSLLPKPFDMDGPVWREALKAGALAPASAANRWNISELPSDVIFPDPELAAQLLSRSDAQRIAQWRVEWAQQFSEHEETRFQAAHFYLDIIPSLELGPERTRAIQLVSQVGLTLSAEGWFGLSHRHLQVALDALHQASDLVEGSVSVFELARADTVNALALGQLESAHRCLQLMEGLARSNEDILDLATLRVRLLRDKGEMQDALKCAAEALERVGRPLPKHTSKATILWDFLRVRWLIGKRTTGELWSLPRAKVPLHCKLQALQTTLGPIQARIQPEGIPGGILRDCLNVLQDGHTPEGVQCWTGYGVLLAWGLDSVSQAVEYAQLALELLEEFERVDLWAQSAFPAVFMVFSWTQPMESLSAQLLLASQRGFEFGDTNTAFLALLASQHLDFFRGKELHQVGQAARNTMELMEWRGQKVQQMGPHALLAFVQRMTTGTVSVSHQEMTSDFPIYEVLSGLLNIQGALILGDLSTALELAQRRLAGLSLPIIGPLHFLYWTYACIALLKGIEHGMTSTSEARKRLAFGRRMLKRWTAHAQFREWRLFWLEALSLSAQGKSEALQRFETALKMANDQSFIAEVAMICEHAAEHCLKLGLLEEAKMYTQRAMANYRLWGATAKVDLLQSMSSRGDDPRELLNPPAISNMDE